MNRLKVAQRPVGSHRLWALGLQHMTASTREGEGWGDTETKTQRHINTHKTHIARNRDVGNGEGGSHQEVKDRGFKGGVCLKVCLIVR